MDTATKLQANTSHKRTRNLRNKMLTNPNQQHITNIIHHDQVGSSDGYQDDSTSANQ